MQAQFEKQILNGSTISQDIKVSSDVVIIGSGAGGAVLAKELAEGGMKVILIEEGGYHPTSSHTDLPFDALSRLYRDRGFSASIGKPFIPLPMGRALGGTTVINSGTCFRTPAHVMQNWSQNLGLHDYNEAEFLPLFERVEKEINVTDVDFAVMSRANSIFHEILAKKGTPGKVLRRNIRGCEGCGFCCYGCPSGAKQSMDVSYLPKAFRSGAQAYTRCKVEKFKVQGNRVQGVLGKFLNSDDQPTGYLLEVSAPKVIVSAGTVFSPRVLWQNYVSRKNPKLKKNLGKNLTLHPANKVYAKFEEEVRGWEGTPQAYYLEEDPQNEGITFEGIFMPPDIVALTVPFIGQKLNQFMRDYKYMATFGFLINDSGTGNVKQLPFIGSTVFYSFNKQDVEKMKKGVAYLSRIFLEGGASVVYSLIHGHAEIRSEQDILKLENADVRPEDAECMAFHPLGTCRMAATEDKGVVGPDFKVFGWEGLYVCDGSVIPSSLGVNPQVTIMSFATKLAFDLIKESRPSP